jgi:hypothetical protein
MPGLEVKHGEVRKPLTPHVEESPFEHQAQRTSLKGVAYTETRQQVVVLRTVDKVVASVTKHANVRCKTVFKTDACIP